VHHFIQKNPRKEGLNASSFANKTFGKFSASALQLLKDNETFGSVSLINNAINEFHKKSAVITFWYIHIYRRTRLGFD
jgi:hypothetical protein